MSGFVGVLWKVLAFIAVGLVWMVVKAQWPRWVARTVLLVDLYSDGTRHHLRFDYSGEEGQNPRTSLVFLFFFYCWLTETLFLRAEDQDRGPMLTGLDLILDASLATTQSPELSGTQSQILREMANLHGHRSTPQGLPRLFRFRLTAQRDKLAWYLDADQVAPIDSPESITAIVAPASIPRP